MKYVLANYLDFRSIRSLVDIEVLFSYQNNSASSIQARVGKVVGSKNCQEITIEGTQIFVLLFSLNWNERIAGLFAQRALQFQVPLSELDFTQQDHILSNTYPFGDWRVNIIDGEIRGPSLIFSYVHSSN